MNLIRTALLAGLVLFLAACATTGGTAFNLQAADAFVVGKTTQADVVAQLGQPQEKASNDDGSPGVTWTYAYAKSGQDGRAYIPVVGPFIAKSHTHEQSLTLIFDGKGVLKSKSQREQNY